MLHDITHLIALNRQESASTRVLAVLKKHGMHRQKAAESLGVSARTFARWLDALSLHPTVRRLEREAKKAGRYHDGYRQSTGRPLGSTDSKPRRRSKSANTTRRRRKAA